jgi:hypothetical protein
LNEHQFGLCCSSIVIIVNLLCQCGDYFLGYFEREMAKHKVVAVDAFGEHEMPAPRDIVDLEVCLCSF